MSNPNPCNTTQVPGPQGGAGSNGTNGTNGVDSFSLIDGGAVLVPAFAATATIALRLPAGSLWMGLQQVIFIAGFGYYQVTALPDGTHATVLNLGYTGNIAGDGLILFTDGAKVSPGGIKGLDGSVPGGTYFAIANDLSEGNPANMRGHLGLGALATLATVDDTNWGATPLAVAHGGTGAANAGAARTNLGLGSLAVQNANAVAITGGAVTGITPLAVADGGTGAAAANAAQDNLGKLLPRYGLIGSLTAADLNVGTSDNAITMRSARYRLDKLTVEDASVNLTAATAGLFTAAGGGGTTLAADQALSALTASTKFKDLTLQSVAGTDVLTAGTLYFRVGTPQGVAATANVWLWGWRYD